MDGSYIEGQSHAGWGVVVVVRVGRIDCISNAFHAKLLTMCGVEHCTLIGSDKNMPGDCPPFAHSCSEPTHN